MSTGFQLETKLKQAIDQIFGEQAYFYNEQYIVKPACDKRTQFLLHKDSDSLRNPPAYVSFWIALDDITRNNGGLQVIPCETLEQTHVTHMNTLQ